MERLWLFGSVARGEAEPDSDIDIMVSVPPAGEFSLLDLAEMHARALHPVGRATDVDDPRRRRAADLGTIRDDLIEVF